MTINSVTITDRQHVYVPTTPNSSNDDMVWVLAELRRISAATILIQESLLEIETRLEALENP